MSILTRIFVVLNMILAVALTALVVPFVLNTNTYKEDYQSERARRIVAEQTAKTEQSRVSSLIANANKVADEFKSEVESLTAQNNLLSTEVQTLKADLIQSQNANADVRSQLARLSTSVEQLSKINDLLQAEVKDRRERALELQMKLVDTADQLRQRLTEVEVLTLQVRRDSEVKKELNDEISRISEQLDVLRSQLPADVADNKKDMVRPDPKFAIRGRVTDVRKVDSEVFVAINVGANDLVKEGMKFMVHDGENYLGDVLVTKVDQDESAGRVVLSRGEIKTNAQIYSGPKD